MLSSFITHDLFESEKLGTFPKIRAFVKCCLSQVHMAIQASTFFVSYLQLFIQQHILSTYYVLSTLPGTLDILSSCAHTFNMEINGEPRYSVCAHERTHLLRLDGSNQFDVFEVNYQDLISQVETAYVF